MSTPARLLTLLFVSFTLVAVAPMAMEGGTAHANRGARTARVKKPGKVRKALRKASREIFGNRRAGKHLRATNKSLTSKLGLRTRHHRIVGVEGDKHGVVAYAVVKKSKHSILSASARTRKANPDGPPKAENFSLTQLRGKTLRLGGTAKTMGDIAATKSHLQSYSELVLKEHFGASGQSLESISGTASSKSATYRLKAEGGRRFEVEVKHEAAAVLDPRKAFLQFKRDASQPTVTITVSEL